MPANAPFGGSLDEQAQYAHDNINSEFSVDAWKAQGGMDSGCPPNYPYRSKRAGGDNACVEHPDNCPHGKTLHGSTCIPWEQANQMFGGGYGDAAPAPQGMPMAPMAPMQPEVGINPPGGQPWGEMPDLSKLLAPYQAPQQSATQNLLSSTMAQKQAPNMVPQSMGSGWTGGQDGLAQLMAKRQKQQPGMGMAQPGTGGNWWV